MSETFKDRVIDVWKERRPDIKSVRKLEEEIGLSNGLIASWSKSEPSKEKVEKVASFFNVSVDYLLGHAKSEQSISIDDLTDAQKQVAYFIDPAATKEDIEQIKQLVEIAKLSRRRL